MMLCCIGCFMRADTGDVMDGWRARWRGGWEDGWLNGGRGVCRWREGGEAREGVRGV